MKRKLLKPVILFLVFVLSLVGTSILTNQSNEDLTTTMASATLPVVMFRSQGVLINELHGYVEEMDVAGMRDSITPMDSGRNLELVVSAYGNKVEDVTYQVRSLDGERLVSEGTLDEISTEKDNLKGAFHFPNILEDEEEYALIIALRCEDRLVRYYTRLVRTQKSHAAECIAFALKFHDYTFREDANDFIPTYMDPATGDSTTLNYVDLSCTLKQITWANFSGKVLTTPIPSVKEISTSYNVVCIPYVLASVNDSGETEYYNVEEYYRLRYTEARMYVLNFERTTNEIFRGENSYINEGTNLLLGIRNSDVEFKANSEYISFVQEGELWCCHIRDNTIIRAFSFLETEGISPRENWDQHDIKIVRLDEAGSVDFIVYGYMNRGEHEGQMGMSVCRYDGISHTVEEEAFLPTDSSFEILKAEMGQLMYENETGVIYLMIGGTVYAINLNTLEVKAEIRKLTEGSYAISESNRYFAWVDPGKEYSCSTLHIRDFQNDKQTDITENDLYLRPLGFLQEDFIYGAAEAADVAENMVGNTIFPMKYLKIMTLSDTGFEVVKEYAKKSRYIGGITVEDSTIDVSLLKKADGQFVAAEEDSIMNKEADVQSHAYVGSITTENKEREVILVQQNQISESKTKLILPRMVILQESRIVTINSDTKEERYYVYSKGDVLLATAKISDAISVANKRMGVVLSRDQVYLWKRPSRNEQTAFADIRPSGADSSASSLIQCISAMLVRNGIEVNVTELAGKGRTPGELLQSQLENKTILDLTGCRAEELAYYISRQAPVLAVTGKKSAVLLTGYSASNLNYYDMEEKKTKSITYEEADQWFAQYGNIFFAYIDK